jgi:hypothetical protein
VRGLVLVAGFVAAAGCGDARTAVAPEYSQAAAPARGHLRDLRLEQGRLFAEVGGTGEQVEVLLATRAEPLAYRGPVVHRRVAELVAPGLVPETTLAALPLGELSRAAREPACHELLRSTLRVLADGRVRAAVVAAPPGGLGAVDLAEQSAGGLVHSWEAALVRRDSPPEALRATLAAYQALLAVDYLVSNQARRSVLVQGGRSPLIAAGGNDAFTLRPVPGALADPLARLARHGTYSALLAERLARLDRDRLVAALREKGGAELLVTPKELDQILERKHGLEQRITTLLKRRGAQKALALP